MGSEVVIWHNPKCSKSRETLKIIEAQGFVPIVRQYLEDPPTTAELQAALQLLELSPCDFVRKKEEVYTELGLADCGATERDFVEAMASNPVLIERPVVFCGGKARIGKPPEKVLEILQQGPSAG